MTQKSLDTRGNILSHCVCVCKWLSCHSVRYVIFIFIWLTTKYYRVVLTLFEGWILFILYCWLTTVIQIHECFDKSGVLCWVIKWEARFRLQMWCLPSECICTFVCLWISVHNLDSHTHIIPWCKIFFLYSN
jgi:hypothetical protein